MKKIIILFLTAMICISIHGQANDKYRLKYNNPDLIVDLGVGLWGMPIPIDYDGDGLMDLLMTCPSTPHKGIFYFHNIGKKSRRMKLYRQPCTASIKSRNGSGRERNRKKGKNKQFR